MPTKKKRKPTKQKKCKPGFKRSKTGKPPCVKKLPRCPTGMQRVKRKCTEKILLLYGKSGTIGAYGDISQREKKRETSHERLQRKWAEQKQRDRETRAKK